MQMTSSSLTTADTHIVTVAISITRGNVNVAPRNAHSKSKPLLDEKYCIQISIYGMEGGSILRNKLYSLRYGACYTLSSIAEELWNVTSLLYSSIRSTDNKYVVWATCTCLVIYYLYSTSKIYFFWRVSFTLAHWDRGKMAIKISEKFVPINNIQA